MPGVDRVGGEAGGDVFEEGRRHDVDNLKGRQLQLAEVRFPVEAGRELLEIGKLDLVLLLIRIAALYARHGSAGERSLDLHDGLSVLAGRLGAIAQQL